MQTHKDEDQSVFMTELLNRAEAARAKKESVITAGLPAEAVIAEWKAHGMTVCIRPDDPQGIIRISVGGGSKTPLPLDYCVLRGDVGEAIGLLEMAIEALRSGQE